MNIQKQLKIKNLFYRQQAKQSIKLNLKSGLGGLLSIAAIACSVAGLINALTAFNVNVARKDLALNIFIKPDLNSPGQL